jgi:predicted extracellular nuclease
MINKYWLWLVIPFIVFGFFQFKYFNGKFIPAVETAGKCNTISVGFYNLENLFDTIDDPIVDDAEFLPSSKNEWNTYRYEKKIHNMSRVILAMNDGNACDMLGVCEIENVNVVNDLLKDEQLKKIPFGVVHYDSPDARGIDVALIYRTDKFIIIGSKPLKVDYDQKDFKTRDILWVQALYKKDTINVFVNHWPSRRGGPEESEPKRVAAATVLANHIAILKNSNPNCKIVCIGDFNDEPNDKSISQVLNAKANADNLCATCLFDPMNILKTKYKLGSHYYKGEWSMFDQIIFSNNLAMPEYFENDLKAVKILKEEWMLKVDTYNDKMQPSRTFEGPKYNGGYSDHLPVFAKLCVR